MLVADGVIDEIDGVLENYVLYFKRIVLKLGSMSDECLGGASER